MTADGIDALVTSPLRDVHRLSTMKRGGRLIETKTVQPRESGKTFTHEGQLRGGINIISGEQLVDRLLYKFQGEGKEPHHPSDEALGVLAEFGKSMYIYYVQELTVN